MMTAALAQNGAAKVYILGRRQQVLDEAAAAIGPNVIPVVCDVSSKESLQAAATSIRDDAGFINLLVCNAGIGGPQVKPPSEGMSAADWAAQHLEHAKEDYTRTFDVNVSSVWYTAMSFLALLEQGNTRANVPQSSQVITTSSIGAFNKMAPGGWAYGQSKVGAALLAKHLAATLPQWNIRSNAIAPGREYLLRMRQVSVLTRVCSVSERDGGAHRQAVRWGQRAGYPQVDDPSAEIGRRERHGRRPAVFGVEGRRVLQRHGDRVGRREDRQLPIDLACIDINRGRNISRYDAMGTS